MIFFSESHLALSLSLLLSLCLVSVVTMSLFPTEAVKVTAEASGYPAISDDVAQAIASDLEYTLRELTQVSPLSLSISPSLSITLYHTHTLSLCLSLSHSSVSL